MSQSKTDNSITFIYGLQTLRIPLCRGRINEARTTSQDFYQLNPTANAFFLSRRLSLFSVTETLNRVKGFSVTFTFPRVVVTTLISTAAWVGIVTSARLVRVFTPEPPPSFFFIASNCFVFPIFFTCFISSGTSGGKSRCSQKS